MGCILGLKWNSDSDKVEFYRNRSRAAGILGRPCSEMSQTVTYSSPHSPHGDFGAIFPNGVSFNFRKESVNITEKSMVGRVDSHMTDKVTVCKRAGSKGKGGEERRSGRGG